MQGRSRSHHGADVRPARRACRNHGPSVLWPAYHLFFIRNRLVSTVNGDHLLCDHSRGNLSIRLAASNRNRLEKGVFRAARGRDAAGTAAGWSLPLWLAAFPSVLVGAVTGTGHKMYRFTILSV